MTGLFSRALLVCILAWPAAAQGPSSSSGAVKQDCAKTMGELPKTWEGQAYGLSGDTLSGVGLKPHLRLWGIRAPTLVSENSAGMRARAALEDMLVAGEHRVACRTAGWDGYCQILAQCTVTAEWPTGSKAEPHDLGLRLVEDGYAYGYDLGAVPQWDKDAGEKVAHFEALARQARKGLWPEWLGETKRE